MPGPPPEGDEKTAQRAISGTAKLGAHRFLEGADEIPSDPAAIIDRFFQFPADPAMTDQQPQQPQQQAMPVFNIEKIYVKDLSLEVPNAPAIFLEREAPQMNMQLNTQSAPVDTANGIFESIITLTITAKIQDKTAFLVELKQAGIFRIQNIPQEAMEPALGVGCPNILFPYAREAVSDAVLKAGFPPLMLQPVNFELMYMQQQQARAQQAGQQPN